MIHSISIPVRTKEASLGKYGSFKDRTVAKGTGTEAEMKAVISANLEFNSSGAPHIVNFHRLALKDDEAVEHHQKAMRCFDARQFQDAHHHFRLALKSDPHNAPAMSDLGVLYFYQNDIANAQDCFERALCINSTHAGSRFNLGLVYYSRCELEQARGQFQMCLDANPSHTRARQHLDALLARWEGGVAANTVGGDTMQREMPLTLSPNSASTSSSPSPEETPAASRSESPQPEEHNLEEPTPQQQSAHHHKRAMKLFNNGQAEQAYEEFQTALKVDPSNAAALSDLGVLHFYRQEHATAERCFAEALQLRPAHAGSHFNLGLIYRNRGELARAREEFVQCVESNPQHASALQHLAEFDALGIQREVAPLIAAPNTTPQVASKQGLPRFNSNTGPRNVVRIAVQPERA